MTVINLNDEDDIPLVNCFGSASYLLICVQLTIHFILNSLKFVRYNKLCFVVFQILSDVAVIVG